MFFFFFPLGKVFWKGKTNQFHSFPLLSPLSFLLSQKKKKKSATKNFTVSPTAILAGLGARGVPSEATLPLEILPAGAFEPLYRSPLDVAGGELPLLPLSVYGALAASRPSGAPPSEASASEFFVFLYSRQQAGLGGLAFEEGEFSVFGYATGPNAAVLLPQISQEDVIVRTRVVSGRERLVVPKRSGGGGGGGGDGEGAE